jgi:hypothetical protein
VNRHAHGVSIQRRFGLGRTVLALLAACVWPAGALAKVTLVQDGQPRAVIVLAEKPTRSAQLAARELQEHLRLMSGAVAPIATEAQERPKLSTPIYVGESKATRRMGFVSYRFAPQESLVRITDKAVVLLGRDDPDTGPITYEKNGAWPGFNRMKAFHRVGSLYAVYEFLERFCGVRWYMPTDIGRVVPKRKTLVLEPTEVRTRPWTSYRVIGYGLWGTPGDKGEVGLYGMRRYKKHAPARDLNLHMLRLRGGGEPYQVNHSVYGYAKRFGKQHPDWFVDGNPGRHTQLLYHHPGVIEQVTKDACDYFSMPFSKRRFGAKKIHAMRVSAGDFFPVMPLDDRNYGLVTKPPSAAARTWIARRSQSRPAARSSSEVMCTPPQQDTLHRSKVHAIVQCSIARHKRLG